jgi:outer membrane receptor protein involved in Fe transport
MESYIKKIYLKLLFVLLFISNNLIAENLENLLDNVNDYAKNNNMNIEYQPSSLTILYGDDLEALGIKTLSEALDFVPGIQTMDGSTNFSRISLRGTIKPYDIINEQIRFYVNGIDVYYNYFSHFPINLIERIEITRGGISAAYGEGGFLGSINIVTKIDNYDENGISLGTGSFNEKNGSVFFNKNFNKWKFGIDSYYLNNDKKVFAPSANLINYNISNSNLDRKKESFEGVEEKAFGINLKNDNWIFNSRYLESTSQNHYGFLGYLDFNDSGYSKYTVSTSQIVYENYISNNNKIKSKIGYLNYNYKLNTYLYKFEPNSIGLYDPHYQVDYTKQDIFSEVSITNSSIKNHQIVYGISFSYSHIPKNNYYTNADYIGKIGLYDPLNDAYLPISSDLTTLSGNEGFLNNIESQTNYSYYVQDTFSFNDNLNFLFNTKINDSEYSDKLINYTISSVYSTDNINIYKATFSKNYRTPSRIESFLSGHLSAFGNKDLKPEKSNTLELIYNYINDNDSFKLNNYYSVYENSIDVMNNGTSFEYYNNEDDLNNYGLEVEYSRNFENRSKFLFNSSYSIYKYKNKEFDSADVNTPIASKITANMGYIYPINSKLSVSGTSKYYGAKALLNDTKIDDVVLFNLSSSYFINDDMKILFSLKNVLDTKYYYYGFNTLDEKMLREGRTWNLSLSYEF